MSSEKNPEAIRRRMDALRNSLDHDVQEVATSVRARTDWRYYVQTYRWLTVGAATAIGYMLVPRRAERVEHLVPEPAALARLLKEEKLVMMPESEIRATSGGMANKLVALALAAGSRAAVGYIGNKLTGAFAKEKETIDDLDASVAYSSSNPK